MDVALEDRRMPTWTKNQSLFPSSLKAPARPFGLVAIPLEVVGCVVAFFGVGKLRSGTLSVISLVR